MSVLNKSRILAIQNSIPTQYRNNQSHNYIWYLSAATTLSICNRPNDVKTIYKYAILQDLEKSLDEDFKIENLSLLQNDITRKFKEALLKSSCIGGLPKAINSLSLISSLTASPDAHLEDEDKYRIRMNDPNFIRRDDYCEDSDLITKRGFHHWNKLYSKVSDKIINNLNNSTPDLWYYILTSCYGPVLSKHDVLNAQDTSLVVICSLVPQDVNPQLYGHLKGAVNVGCDAALVSAIQNMSLTICEWCDIYLKEKSVRL